MGGPQHLRCASDFSSSRVSCTMRVGGRASQVSAFLDHPGRFYVCGKMNLRPLHLFTSSSCSGDSDPIFIPGRRAAGWFGVDPPHLRWTLRVGSPRVARGGCEGVGDVPGWRGACRTQGRGPASRPWPDHWNEPAPAGCRCGTPTIAFARECGAVPPLAHVESRGPTDAGARAVAWEGDVTCPSLVGGRPGPGRRSDV